MIEYRLTLQAAADLDVIFDYTLEAFGLLQASRYLESIKDTFALIAAQPEMGRLDIRLGPEVRRHEHRSHVIIYERDDDGVLILAVEHHRRILPRRP